MGGNSLVLLLHGCEKHLAAPLQEGRQPHSVVDDRPGVGHKAVILLAEGAVPGAGCPEGVDAAAGEAALCDQIVRGQAGHCAAQGVSREQHAHAARLEPAGRHDALYVRNHAPAHSTPSTAGEACPPIKGQTVSAAER